nr:MAG: hypothetical protein BECKSD772D_GA0070982_10352 [Candidatus Kentron sp. SD]
MEFTNIRIYDLIVALRKESHFFERNLGKSVSSMYRKNKNSERTGVRASNTPLGAYCYALTNKTT